MQIQNIKNKNITVKKEGKVSQKTPNFKGFTEVMMDNVFLNKALFDLTGSDIPWVAMANNKDERRERINRAALSVGMIFISPLIILPFVNRFAMKNIVGLTSKFNSKNYNAIRLSNEYLVNKEKTMEGLQKLSKNSLSNELQRFYYQYILKKPLPELKIDSKSLLESVNGDSELLRKKIIIAKNIVLGSDFMIIMGSFGHVGFYNNRQTKNKTGQDGFAAELKMADKEIIEKRAAEYKKNERMRYGIFFASLAGLVVGLPLAIKHGLSSSNNNIFKKIGKHFDYQDAIFMKRLPMALSFVGAHFGVFMASRNNTERKDNGIRSSTALSIFFLGDILLTSLLGKISDRMFGTKITKENTKESFLGKILPGTKNLEELKALNSPKTLKMAKGIFWANFVSLAAMMGVITPYIINKMIKKDVSEDAKKAQGENNLIQPSFDIKDKKAFRVFK